MEISEHQKERLSIYQKLQEINLRLGNTKDDCDLGKAIIKWLSLELHCQSLKEI